MAGKKGSKGRFSIGLAAAALVIVAVLAFLLVNSGWYGGKPANEALPPTQALPPAQALPQVEATAPEHAAGARLAIVIDDMGADIKKLHELLQIDGPMTVSVLPHLRYTAQVANEAHSRKDWEVLLHLPMEPKDTAVNDPGKGALFTTMSAGEIRRIVEDDLKDVPYADGANNHMGSKFTENAGLMKVVLGVMKKKNIFFLDSRTSSSSVGGKVAKELGVREAGRNVFLDNTRDTAYIKGQLAQAAAIARKKGSAVAIGHPYPETIAALRQSVPELKNGGIEFVKLSDIVEK